MQLLLLLLQLYTTTSLCGPGIASKLPSGCHDAPLRAPGMPVTCTSLESSHTQILMAVLLCSDVTVRAGNSELTFPGADASKAAELLLRLKTVREWATGIYILHNSVSIVRANICRQSGIAVAWTLVRKSLVTPDTCTTEVFPTENHIALWCGCQKSHQ